MNAWDDLLRYTSKNAPYEESRYDQTSTYQLLDEDRPLVVIIFDKADTLIDGNTLLSAIEKCGPTQPNIAAFTEVSSVAVTFSLPGVRCLRVAFAITAVGNDATTFLKSWVIELRTPWMKLGFDLTARVISVTHGFKLTGVTSRICLPLGPDWVCLHAHTQ